MEAGFRGRLFFVCLHSVEQNFNSVFAIMSNTSQRVQITFKMELKQWRKVRSVARWRDPVGRPLRKYMLSLNYGYFEAYNFLFFSG